MFNFDIVVIIIILYAIINGLMLGGYRQVLSILNIFIPFIIIFFSTSYLVAYLTNIPLFNSIVTFIYNVLKMILNISLEDFIRLFIILATYLMLYYLVRFIIKKQFLNTKKILSKKVNPKSRYIGGGLGLISACIIIMFAFVLIKPLVNINYAQPVTKILLQIQ